MAQYKAKVSFFADTKDLLKGVGNVDRMMGKLGGTVQRHSRKFLMAGTAMAGGLAALTAQGIAYGTTIDRMSKMTGVAAEDMSRLAYSAELYHGSAEMVEKGVRSLAQKMQYAKDGLETYRREFVRAGIDVDAWGDKMPALNDMILELADSFATNADGTAALAGATVLLGGRQSALIPWMKQGSAVIRGQFEEADRLGNTLSGTTAEGMERAGTSIKKMRLALRGMGVAVATVLAPAIEGITGKLVVGAAVMQAWSSHTKDAAIKTVGFGAGGLLAAGAIGRLAPALGAATGPLALFVATLTGGLVTIEWLDAGIGNLVRKLETMTAGPLREATGGLALWLTFVRSTQFGVIGLAGAVKKLKGEAEFIGPPVDELALLLAQVEKQADAAAATINEKLNVALKETTNAAGTLRDILPAALIPEPVVAGILRGESATRGLAGAVSGVTSQLEGQLPVITDTMSLWDDFSVFVSDNLMPTVGAFFGSMDQFMNEAIEKQLKGWDQLKKGSLKFLREVLTQFAKAKALELAGIQITESGKAVMTGQWWMLPVIAAGYAAAVAGINKLTSFDVGAKVVRGGAFTGQLDVGERLINLRDFKSLVLAGAGGGGGGGTNINVNVSMYGVQPGTPTADNEWRRLADFIARRVGR